MQIKNIIFDWDGTLAKTLDLWLEGYQRAFRQRGLHYEDQDITSEFFHNHHEVEQRHPDLGFPQIAEDTRAHVSSAMSEVELYDGALQTLEHLAADGLQLGLVTSSARHMLQDGLGAHDLQDFFVSTLAGDDGYGHKPDTRPFAETLERLGARADQTLVIGDSHVDVLAGQALGCSTCWFAPEPHRLFHDFEQIRALQADHEIDSIPALADLV